LRDQRGAEPVAVIAFVHSLCQRAVPRRGEARKPVGERLCSCSSGLRSAA
jgi:hypothetical protein